MGDPSYSITDAWQVEIVDHHQPTLTSGDYSIEVTQSIRAGDTRPQGPPTTQMFSVAGPRFSLSPQDVHAVFPPPGSVGDYSGVLPHVMFERDTLPWERCPDHVKRSIDVDTLPPWLALIIVHEDEESSVKIPADRAENNPFRVQTCQVKDLIDPSILETADSATDMVIFVEFAKPLVDTVLPTVNQLAKLAHVRRSRTEPVPQSPETAWSEFAIVLCNRPPKPEMRNTVHLVSVEARYRNDGTFAVAPSQSTVRLVCLKSWQFTCTVPGDQDFRARLERLNSGNLQLAIPSPNISVRRHVETGAVPLPHARLDGNATISWYRGPLAPFQRPDRGSNLAVLNLGQFKELVRDHLKSGIDDVSYAAAWELGRLLTVGNPSVATALYNWKRCRSRDARMVAADARFAGGVADLPIERRVPQFDFPREWFQQLALLKGVPFDYLIPDERLLPNESIRFFCVDPFWIKCLISGAFSVGSTSEQEFEICALAAQHELAGLPLTLSGFLLRSEAVSAWPAMETDGYLKDPGKVNEPGTALAPVEPMRLLSKDVLMCMFEAVVEAVDLHLPPQALNFELEVDDPLSFNTYASSSDMGRKCLATVPSVRFVAV